MSDRFQSPNDGRHPIARAHPDHAQPQSGDMFTPSPPPAPQSQPQPRAASQPAVPARLVRRLVVDVAMSVLMAIEMLYSLTGNALHELVGVLLFVGMGVHLFLSRRWLAGTLRLSGKAGGRRTALLVVAVLYDWCGIPPMIPPMSVPFA